MSLAWRAAWIIFQRKEKFIHSGRTWVGGLVVGGWRGEERVWRKGRDRARRRRRRRRVVVKGVRRSRSCEVAMEAL